MEKIKKLKKLIEESNNIVAFTGAGISTLSGIKDFRSKDGLYNMKYKFPPEEILSRTFFLNNTEEFYKFYKDKMNCLDKKPNIVHKFLAKLEKENKLKAVITQNIDGLHTKAGSTNVLELHGSIYRNNCMKCNKSYDANYVFKSTSTPKCSCGGIIKPDVVLYEEPLDYDVTSKAIKAVENCDLLLILGTSLTVYPASNYVNFYKGDKLVIVNKMITSFDNRADLVIHDDLEKVFNELY